MAQSQRSPIDEELLSGYLDGALPQSEAQKVRISIEDDPELRALYDDLKAMRDVAGTTHFVTPPEESWPELPKNPVSRLSRSLGWTLMLVWLAVVLVFELWIILSKTGDPFEIFLMLGLPGAFVLLFASVLIDRIRELKTDRYRGIHR